MIPTGDYGGPPPPPPFVLGTETLQGHISCSTCGQTVTFPRGAAMVRCPTCGDVLIIRRTDSGQETGGQGVCGGCRMILLYQMGIQLVSCSFCGSVTLLPRPESFQCRGCKMTLNYAPGPASLVRCVVCHEIQEVQPLQPLVPQPVLMPPPLPQAAPREPVSSGPGAGESTDSPPASTPSPPSTAPTATPAAGASTASPVPLQFPLSPEPPPPPPPPPPTLPSLARSGGGYGGHRPAGLTAPAPDHLRGMQTASRAGAGMAYGQLGAGGPPPGMFGGNGVSGAHPGVPPYPLHPAPMRAAPGPTSFTPPLQPGLPSAAPHGQRPPPPYPATLPPGAFPPVPPMYVQGGYGAYGAMVGGVPFWQPAAQLPFANPPPQGVGDWRAPPPGAYPAVFPIGLGAGGGAVPMGITGLAPAPPMGRLPMMATGAAQPGSVPSSEARRAQLAQLEDGDLPSSAAALQRRLEDLQLGREAAAGGTAASPSPDQQEAPDGSPNGAAAEVAGGPATGDGALPAGAADEQPRLPDTGEGGSEPLQGAGPGSAAAARLVVVVPHGAGVAASRLDGRTPGSVSSSGAEGARAQTEPTNGGPPDESHASPDGVPPSSSGSAPASLS